MPDPSRLRQRDGGPAGPPFRRVRGRGPDPPRRWSLPRGERNRTLGDFAAELDAMLEAIDFEEVTDEDRVAFVRGAVEWQVRQALEVGRFDLASSLKSLGEVRVARLLARRGRSGPS